MRHPIWTMFAAQKFVCRIPRECPRRPAVSSHFADSRSAHKCPVRSQNRARIEARRVRRVTFTTFLGFCFLCGVCVFDSPDSPDSPGLPPLLSPPPPKKMIHNLVDRNRCPRNPCKSLENPACGSRVVLVWAVQHPRWTCGGARVRPSRRVAVEEKYGATYGTAVRQVSTASRVGRAWDPVRPRADLAQDWEASWQVLCRSSADEVRM